MSNTQQTFGNVKYRLITGNQPFCNRSTLTGKPCENRAIVEKNSSLENGVEFICGIHLKVHEKEKIEKLHD
jgi:hypothetical protein